MIQWLQIFLSEVYLVMALRNLMLAIVFGSMTSSALYTAPTVETQTIDSVSAVSVADSAEYGTSSVVVQGHSVWTAVHQQPVTMQFYPGSIWTTPLPANPALLTNSDEVIKNVYQNSDTPSNAIPTCLSSTPGGDSCSNKKVFYYASQSDPIYKVISAAHVTSQSANNPVGKFFHLTNQAHYSSNVYDQSLSVWDQSTDIDATPGGRIFSDYEFCGSGSCPRSLGNCTCATTACASTTPACQIAGNYTDYDYPLNDPLKGIQDGVAWSNINSGGGSMFQRMAEVQNNQMNHAILVSAACVAGGVSFPSNSDAWICSDTTNAIHTGALVYIDSAYNCSALALWQQPFCTALQTYGGYMGSTSSGSYASKPGFFDNAIESPIAEYQAGGFTPPYTFFSFLNTYSGSVGSPVYCTGSPITRCNIFPLLGMPGLITGDSENGHVPHLHVVDPCVPRHMAGQSATCTGSWQD